MKIYRNTRIDFPIAGGPLKNIILLPKRQFFFWNEILSMSITFNEMK